MQKEGPLRFLEGWSVCKRRGTLTIFAHWTQKPHISTFDVTARARRVCNIVRRDIYDRVYVSQSARLGDGIIEGVDVEQGVSG
jgi:hypothetical protein